MREQERPLPQVVEEQRRKNEAEPRDANGLPAKVAHVGIQRFAPGHDEEHGAQYDESSPAIGVEETKRVARIEGFEDVKVGDDPAQAEHGDGHEPDNHDWSEQLADGGGSF